MEIKSDVKTASALLDQFYEKRRLLILSAPNISDSDYTLQNIMIQVRKPAVDWTLISTQHRQVLRKFNKHQKSVSSVFHQKADCGLDLRQVTVIELLGSPPRETGRIKESLLGSEVIEGLRYRSDTSPLSCSGGLWYSLGERVQVQPLPPTIFINH